MAASPALREVTIVVEFERAVWKVATIGWSQVDASLYVRAFGPLGQFRYGQSSIPSGQHQETIRTDDQGSSTAVPHLSLHESGQVHVRKRRRTVAGPMFIPPLAELRGQHVATIQCVRFDRLARFEGSPRADGDRRDVVIPAEPGVESGRLPIYVNGESEAFAPSRVPPVRFMLRRATLERPLHVGLGVVPQKRINEGGEGTGVVLIAGFDPTAEDVDRPGDYMFVVAA
jgi:hypothetical protein